MATTTRTRGWREHGGAVLITGATGFVGGELLARLIAEDRRPLVCLVRAASVAEAEARGAAALGAVLGRRPTREEWARVTWEPGDITQPDLGLAPARRRALVREIGEIFHCAASTRFDLPLAEADAINFGGLRAVYALAAEAGNFRRFHHVSTAYASGRAGERVIADVLPADGARAFRNTYERTKARGERFLRSQTRVPYTIYRPSIVVGDSRSGRTTSWNVVYFPMRLMAKGHLPFAPARGRALLDCVPVDFVVDAMIALGRRSDTQGRTFHLTAGDAALSVHDVVQHTYAGIARQRQVPFDLGTTVVGPARWWLLSQAYRLWLRGSAGRVLERFAQYVPYTRIDGVYENRAEAALLADEGVRLAPPAVFFPRIVDYALGCDFGRRPMASDQRPLAAVSVAAAG